MKLGIAVFLFLFILRGASSIMPGSPANSLSSDSGQIQIIGKSNLNTFSLTYPLEGSVVVDEECANTSILHIPIVDFETSSNGLKKDFEKLLQSENHPEITIQFSGLTDFAQEYQSNTLQVTITLAGTSKLFEIPCAIDLISPDKLYVRGRVTLSMSEFLLEPPVKVFGLVRVEDLVDVLFQVNFTVKD
jgi:hypothetical protein